MFADPALAAFYGAPMLLSLALWGWHQTRRSRRNRALQIANRGAGLAEPPGLHPLIDAAACIGCGACVRACPETDALGLIARTARLIEPAACIGHGTCAAVCPTQAIALVYGSAAHGFAMPLLGAACETSVPGIHAVGELAGAGLIARAMAQAVGVVEHIVAQSDVRGREAGCHDLAIVGCGPAGLAAALAARAAGLDFVVIDQASLGGAVAHYPRGKLVQSAPMRLPILGDVRLGAIDKDALIAFWRTAIAQASIAPRFEETVLDIAREGAVHRLTTSKATLVARRVILATGRGGTPRRLDVPGEDLPKVVYRLTDPAQYAGQNVLVAGGGDSACEAAIALADTPDTHVTLVHRGADLHRATAENRAAIDALARTRRIDLRLETRIGPITTTTVALADGQAARVVDNGAVLACIGGTLPSAWLARLGIACTMLHGTAINGG